MVSAMARKAVVLMDVEQAVGLESLLDRAAVALLDDLWDALTENRSVSRTVGSSVMTAAVKRACE